ncbi:hypothetical protein [Arthrobacter sp. RAF14]|uniref:hypothetical protein n=1 Tax=Arthrobacter sp. RAF14 TaxID=3233051 RepID=UPI003F8F8080
MSDEMNRQTGAPAGVVRRQVVRAGVWSVPVIAAAVAAPLASASPSQVLSLMILNGDSTGSDGLSTTFAGVNLNEPSVPLILGISTTSPAGPASGALTATLSPNAVGVAGWEGGAGSVFVAAVEDGGAVLPFEALGYGAFTLTVSMGTQTWLLNIIFSA